LNVFVVFDIVVLENVFGFVGRAWRKVCLKKGNGDRLTFE